jgi:hypothetical protein
MAPEAGAWTGFVSKTPNTGLFGKDFPQRMPDLLKI